MGQTVNFSTKYEKQVKQMFSQGSILQGRLNTDYDFIGNKSVRVYTIQTMELNDYNRTASGNRYGTPQEVGDSVQELTMTQDKSYTGIIDKGNSMDQSINKAAKFITVQTNEVVIPTKDQRGFSVLSHNGGKIVGSATAIDKTNVVSRMAAARSWFIQRRVPQKGRTWYARTLVYDALIDCEQFRGLDKLQAASLIKGQVGELFGAPVVEVPDDLFPAGVNFLLVHKAAGTSPSKIADAKMHVDPPGISGNLAEARYYWDTFVTGAKADGIYVDVTTGGGVSTLAAVTINATTGAITGGTAGATVRYTTDGSDPRYSISALVGTAPVLPTGKTTVRAYQANDADPKVFASPVATVKVDKA